MIRTVLEAKKGIQDNRPMGTNSNMPAFHLPNPFERFFNRAFGFLAGLGFGLRHNYLLQVSGRKTGQVYSTPVNLLEFRMKRFLVAPRGHTQWVRNAESSGEVTLKKGRNGQTFRLRPIPDAEKPEILKQYPDRFTLTVQRYFPVPAGSPPQAFTALSANYPVFELLAR